MDPWARPERDEDERAVVHRLARARKAPRDAVNRARMIELSWSGLRVPTIPVELDCSQKTVRCRLHRFNRAGLPAGTGGKLTTAPGAPENTFGAYPHSAPAEDSWSSIRRTMHANAAVGSVVSSTAWSGPH
ncbi:helix-turn-helix domain-containing protein [Streptomyces adustus]|uniref:helix-turn-helix domain-containing protein n=1 Tax=Streptomyces adustus TaxID=1609272 RepID=UPI00371F7699